MTFTVNLTIQKEFLKNSSQKITEFQNQFLGQNRRRIGHRNMAKVSCGKINFPSCLEAEWKIIVYCIKVPTPDPKIFLYRDVQKIQVFEPNTQRKLYILSKVGIEGRIWILECFYLRKCKIDFSQFSYFGSNSFVFYNFWIIKWNKMMWDGNTNASILGRCEGDIVSEWDIAKYYKIVPK